MGHPWWPYQEVLSVSSRRKPIMGIVFERAVPFILRALTPLHPGSGARVSGLVDLPVQREVHTDLPVIYGSSLKGALRAWTAARGTLSDEEIKEIFGPPPGEGDRSMGRVVFTDAKLLLMPVKSLKGIHGWITSPFLIERFRRDMKLIKELAGKETEVQEVHINGDETALVAPDSQLKFSLGNGQVVVIEDMIFDIKEDNLAFLNALGRLEEEIRDRVIVLSDNILKRLLKRAIAINPHIAISEETGTVQNLWFQEDLPTETMLYSVAFTATDYETLVKKVLSGIVHVGGDVTTGLGFAEVIQI